MNNITNNNLISSTSDTNLYLLQVDNNINSEFIESIPLHLLINNVHQAKSEPLLLPILDNSANDGQRQLQLCIDPNVILECRGQRTQKYGEQAISSQKFSQEATEITGVSSAQSRDTGLNKSFQTSSCNKTYVSSNLTNLPCERNTPESTGKNQKIQNYVHIADRVVPPKAVAVLPTTLQMRLNCVSPRRTLPARVRFGPLRGVISKRLSPSEISELISVAAASNMPIFFCKKTDESVCHVNMSDYEKSNWLSLLPLGSRETANVWVYEENSELYGITAKSLPSRTPLMIGYSKTYAEEYNLPTNQPILDIHEALPSGRRQWWCSKCNCTLYSQSLLQRHLKVCHKDTPPRPRRYRCSVCFRTFARLFTLKRHMSRICKKKPEPVENTSTSVEVNKNIGLCSTPNVEDNKVPSDESFQNYSQGLDFSINLFDTDRIPNLDISGSSRSENDFNPFAGGFKDDNSFINETEFHNNPVNLNHISKSDNKSPSKTIEKIMILCPYCKKTVLKEKYRQHFRECPSRRYECQCGKVFNNKQHMLQHIYKNHKEDIKSTSVDEAVPQSSIESQYKCEECKHDFKRRGMLVNHMWRVHNKSAAIPLERRVRHYPCGSCPKIYRAAAKRDKHVRVHHPGVVSRAAPIDGERRTYEPATCTACPRQYVTHAKLLQHIRSHHPHLSIPEKLKTRSKRKSK